MRNLWRLSDEIIPLHTHDDRDVLVHRDDTGSVTVLDGERAASEIVASRGLGCELEEGPDSSLIDIAAAQAADASRLGGAVSRRSVLTALSALGALTVVSATPRYSFAAGGTTGRDVLVVVFLRGAMDGLQVVVPHGDSAYYAARPTIGVKLADLLILDDTFGFHPAMKPLQPLWQAGELAVVQAAGNPAATRSHFDAQLDMERAAPSGMRSGWLGRHLAAVSTSTDLVRAVTVGNRAAASASGGFPTAAFSDTLENVDVEVWSGARARTTAAITSMYGSAGGALAVEASRTLSGINDLAAARSTPAGTAAYSSDEFGRGLREVARVIKSGAPVEAACLDLGGWDMHADQGGPSQEWGRMRRTVSSLATSLAAFRSDLGSHWGRVTVVAMSEFGRRVQENSTNGTDHGHGNLMLVAGKNVAGGRIYGSWPGLGADDLHDGDLQVTTDYRSVLAEILTRRLATPDLTKVFPGFTPTPLGVIRSS